MYCCPCLRLRAHLSSRDYITFDLKLSFNVIGLSMTVLCVQDKTCKFFLPRFVITQVINFLNGNWRHHLLSNKVGQNSCPLDNIHFKFSVICVRFMYKNLTLCYIFFLFLIWRRLSFLKTFLVYNAFVNKLNFYIHIWLFQVYCSCHVCYSM